MSDVRPDETVSPSADEYIALANATVLRLDQENQKLKGALRFIKELSGECMENGDVRIGTAAEVAMRHIWRRADETL